MTDRMNSELNAGFLNGSCLVPTNEIEQALSGKTKPCEKVNRGSLVSTLNSVSINSDTAYCLGNLILATRFRDRLLGFLVKRPKDCVLLISPCNAIHTFGMKRNLDIAFFNEQGKVVLAQRNIPPGKIVRCMKARGVFEAISHVDKRWFYEGDEVKVYV